MSELPSYQYFSSPAERAMIAECGFRVAEYLHDEQVGTLVLVDQAARNIHIPVRDAWDIEYPEKPKPTIYFLNPDGFLSPDTHQNRDYTNMVAKMVEQQHGISSAELVLRSAVDPEFKSSLNQAGKDERDRDLLMDRRKQVNAQITALAARAIPRDHAFNGRVLVLDACRHTGTSEDGIARALRDIGIVDVRTGVVNNISTRSDDPDFIVFDDREIEDVCKPFGDQHGLSRAPDMITHITPEGLSDRAKLARAELHMMKHELTELRRLFGDISTDPHVRASRIIKFESLLARMLGAEIGLANVSNNATTIIRCSYSAAEDSSADSSNQ